MLKKDIDEKLNSRFQSKLKNFEYVENNSIFMRKINHEIFQYFCFDINRFTNFYSITLCYGFSLPTINLHSKKALNDSTKKNDPTFSYSLANDFSQKRGRHSVYSEDDLNSVLDLIAIEIKELIVPIFEEIIDFDSLFEFEIKKSMRPNRMCSVPWYCNMLIFLHFYKPDLYSKYYQEFYDISAKYRSELGIPPLIKTDEYLKSLGNIGTGVKEN